MKPRHQDGIRTKNRHDEGEGHAQSCQIPVVEPYIAERIRIEMQHPTCGDFQDVPPRTTHVALEQRVWKD